MSITIILFVGLLAVVISWLAAVRILQSDKFSGTVAVSTPVDTSRRNDVLTYSTL